VTECNYEELEHTAEIGLRVRAPTPADLFACAATGMFAISGIRSATTSNRRSITIESSDAESLLVDWLNELLYLYESTGDVYDQVQFATWTSTRLEATVEGGAPVLAPIRSIKAVTYHGLVLAENTSIWLAEIYFDV
jgi:SHS2 domain-containing protein